MAPYWKYCIYGEFLKLSMEYVANLMVKVRCRTRKNMSQNWLYLPDINNYKLLSMYVTCECINDTFRKLLPLKYRQVINCSIKM